MLDQRIDEVRGCIATDFSFAQLVPTGGISLKRYLDNGDLIATRVLRRFYAMKKSNGTRSMAAWMSKRLSLIWRATEADES